MRQKQIIVILLLLLAAVTAVRGAMKPDLGLLKFTVRGDTAYGNGETDDRSVGQIDKFLDANPQVNTLVLGKMWGTKDVDMNFRIARRIRKDGLKTHLTSNSYIASGAVDIFLSGVERTMECGALIGVHSWSSGGGYYPANIGSDPREKIHVKFMRDMGIDPSFYAFTRDAALPEDMYYLTTADIERFGLLTQPANCD